MCVCVIKNSFLTFWDPKLLIQSSFQIHIFIVVIKSKLFQIIVTQKKKLFQIIDKVYF